MHAEIIPFPTTPRGVEAFRLLEAALIDYAVRYGLTEKARVALSGAQAAVGPEKG